jgi:transcriptional regulator with XRE-family HTH domain
VASLSDVLPRLRTLVGITSQRELARRAGISRNTVNKLENNQGAADHATLTKVAHALATDSLTGRRDDERYGALLEILTGALYGRDVSAEIERLTTLAPGPSSRGGPRRGGRPRRARDGQTDYLIPALGRRMSRAERDVLRERIRRAKAEIDALFDAFEATADSEGDE